MRENTQRGWESEDSERTYICPECWGAFTGGHYCEGRGRRGTRTPPPQDTALHEAFLRGVRAGLERAAEVASKEAAENRALCGAFGNSIGSEHRVRGRMDACDELSTAIRAIDPTTVEDK